MLYIFAETFEDTPEKVDTKNVKTSKKMNVNNYREFISSGKIITSKILK